MMGDFVLLFVVRLIWVGFACLICLFVNFVVEGQAQYCVGS